MLTQRRATGLVLELGDIDSPTYQRRQLRSSSAKAAPKPPSPGQLSAAALRRLLSRHRSMDTNLTPSVDVLERLVSATHHVPVGNQEDLEVSRNPVVRRVARRFGNHVCTLVRAPAGTRMLDVGCGDGRRAARFARDIPQRQIIGLDLEHPKLRAAWAQRGEPNLAFRAGSLLELPFENAAFDLVTAIEVLEHVSDPHRALDEIRRVCRGYLIASVPREPLWRGLNLLRVKYVRDLGNTPGHLNHWSRRGFRRLLSQHGRVVRLDSRLPWTIGLVELSPPSMPSSNRGSAPET